MNDPGTLYFSTQLITEYTPNEMDQSATLKQVNQEKNRPGSIIPVNMKRVLLPARPGIDGSDYINATYLQVSLCCVLAIRRKLNMMHCGIS